MRTIYRSLLQLHPPAFRRRFAPEMMCIFDEATESSRALPLLLDAGISLARQWLLRSGLWMIAVAIAGAILQITAGGLIWLAPGHSARTSLALPDGMDGLIFLILCLTGAVVLMVTLASLWVRRFFQRRLP
jgi:nitrate reductase gamma subunit